MPTPAERRVHLRNSLWADSEGLTWDRRMNKGFTTIPRYLPLVMHLIKQFGEKKDPSVVYFDLWTRSFDEGLVTVTDDEAMAYSSGYSGKRAARTWRERIEMLEKLGFIRVAASGSRKIAYILLINPIIACAALREERGPKFPEEWWTSFVGRAAEIGAELPPELPDYLKGNSARKTTEVGVTSTA